MTSFRLFLLIISAVLLLASCGVVRHSANSAFSSDSSSSGGSVSGLNEAQASLEQAHRDWKGTPYVLGGTTENGVDCSSFVKIVFDRYFDVELPPNTRTQLNAGNSIRRQALRTGDLVFFRTGRSTLHVGIIVEEDEFLHASTSQGVMTSELSENYWSSRYLAARRVMN